MKRLNKKLQELSIAHGIGNLENFINSLSPNEVTNYLHLIETKKRAIISESFNKIIRLEKTIEEIKNSSEKTKKQNGSFNLRLSWLNDDLIEIKNHRKAKLNYWEKIEKILKQKAKENKLKKIKRTQEK